MSLYLSTHLVPRIVVVLEKIQHELENFRRTDAVNVSLFGHGDHERLLEEVVLKVVETVPPDDFWARVRAKHLEEELKHRGRTGPGVHQRIRDLANKTSLN